MAVYCTDRYKRRGKGDARADRHPRFVRRRRGREREAGGDHRRQPGPRPLARARVLAGGARVALVARTEKDLKAVADELPGPSLVLRGDVTDEDFNEAVADAMVAEWGGVDVWICNAGISPIVAGPRETDPSVWRKVLDVNLTGAFLGARAAARVMRGRAADLHRVGARRAATRGSRVQRVEGGSRRPGQGPRARPRARGHHGERRRAGLVRLTARRGMEEEPRARRGRARAHRAGRWGAATDLAGAYQFLASDASAFVTGTVLTVDGGYLLV